ncbi:hypothetical protein IWQ62_002231 [Dispira parvispora]|uniref:C2 domain-containing protein n=1 Tax=Dispira parvispora TaxID=1520584 RepID=A0A9W8AW39_9FUNG|nr:hypothetical protein IWQ62_002231 [Dispira parvispora]
MPCLLKIRIISARNLPVMDRKTELTDAYVEVRFADLDMQKTAICRQTLNPVWNEDFRLEVINDAILQNEPLELRILDYDAITTDDVIGTVLLDLNPLLVSLETPRPLPPPTSSGVKSEGGFAAPVTTVPDGLPEVTLPQAPNASLLPSYTGWLPVTHSLLGIRGEIQVQVRLQFFGDANPFKDSSAGVHIFSSTHTPDHWVVEEVLGFVDALVVEDDPEYHWSDSFRTPRASNDARQKTFYRIAGQLRRLLGRKTLDRGGNAITGFKQEFDIEPEEHVITARAIGTAVKVVPKAPAMTNSSSSLESGDDHTSPVIAEGLHDITGEHRDKARPTVSTIMSQTNNPADEATPALNIQPSEAHSTQTMSQYHAQPRIPTTVTSDRDSDRPTLGQKFRNATRKLSLSSAQETSDVPALNSTSKPIPRRRRRHSSYSSATSHSFSSLSSSPTSSRSSSPSINPPTIEPWSQVIFTLHDFPPGALQRLGGVVSAKSVKLIEDDSEKVREMWWDEVREEIKSHARNLGFPHVIGYTETMVLTEEAACVLSAVGTAAALDLNRLIRASHHNKVTPELSLLDLWTTRDSDGLENHSNRRFDINLLAPPRTPGPQVGTFGSQRSLVRASSLEDIGKAIPSLLDTQCGMCHITDPQDVSYSSPVNFTRCSCCKKKYVPEIILSTTEIPPDLSIVDMGCLVEAHVCRPSKLGAVDDQAAAISDAIPFVEYDLHRQLVYKLRVLGMNAIFNLKFHLAISEEWMISLASGTAVYITALPTPPPLRISRTIEVVDDEDRRFLEIQQTIMRLSASNRQRLDDAFRRKIQLLEWYQQRRSSARRSRKPTYSSDVSQPSLVDDSELADGRVPNDSDSMASETTTSSEDTDSEVTSQRSVFHPYQPERYFAVQVDDDEDEDLMAALLGVQLPDSFLMVNTDFSSCFRQLQEAQHLRKVAVGDELPTEEPVENDNPTSNDPNLGFIAHFYQNVLGRSGNAHPFTQNLTLFRQFRLDSTMKHPSRALVAQFTSLHETLVYRLQRATAWCMVAGVRYHLMIQDDQEIQLILHATALTQPLPPARLLGGVGSEQSPEPCSNLSSPAPNDILTSRRKTQHRKPSSTPSHDSSWLNPFRALQTHYRGKRPVPAQSIPGKSVPSSSRSIDIKESKPLSFSHFSLPGSFASSSPSSPHMAPKAGSAQISAVKLASREMDPSLGRAISPAEAVPDSSRANPTLTAFPPLGIKLCTLPNLPLVNTVCYLGRISLHFIKEVTLHNEPLHPHLASFDGFVYQFLNECQATLRAHVAALGGNALLSLHIDQCLVEESLKNHAYALASISGDVVYSAPMET